MRIRRATAADAEDAAGVWLRSFAAALPTVRRAHTDEQVRDWFREVLVPRHGTWVAVEEASAAAERVVGLLVLNGIHLDQLYLEPDRRGQGIGDELVGLAKRLSPDRLELWTFQVNDPARRFYRRHGFTEVQRTDGSANDEREPDVRLRWNPDRYGR